MRLKVLGLIVNRIVMWLLFWRLNSNRLGLREIGIAGRLNALGLVEMELPL